MTARAVILGCSVDRLDMRQTVERCRERLEAKQHTQHVSVNAAKVVAVRSDRRLAEILERSELVTADGMSVVWASRLLGQRLPERVAGIDLMAELLALAHASGYRVYILGARQEVLERAVGNIRSRHPELEIVGYRDGYFGDDESESVRSQIRDASPDIVFVAMSSPRKEYWMSSDGRLAGATLVVGVGGSIDVWAGITQRAPRWMQRSGLEWAYRLLQEPRRLGRRYLVTNGAFAAILAKALARRAVHAAAAQLRQGEATAR